jgi:hypothetical protein
MVNEVSSFVGEPAHGGEVQRGESVIVNGIHIGATGNKSLEVVERTPIIDGNLVENSLSIAVAFGYVVGVDIGVNRECGDQGKQGKSD